MAVSGGKFVPLTAVALIVETTRSKTAGPDDARRETAADAEDDPFPGMGIDDHTPLGDTSRHSDAERVATPERGSGPVSGRRTLLPQSGQVRRSARHIVSLRRHREHGGAAAPARSRARAPERTERQ